MNSNNAYWNELADVHVRGEHYPVGAVVSGRSTLRSVDRDLLRTISASRVLHSHCHIGLDTVSLARSRAHVTGMDYSERAIGHAREVSRLAGTSNCTFFVADSSLPAVAAHAGSYDLYFASYGVLVWVPDVARWFRAAASYLSAQGTLVLIDEHPIAATFQGGTSAAQPVVGAPYFESAGSYTTDNDRSYSGDTAPLQNTTQLKWPHSMADVVNGALKAGFSVRELREYPFAHYRATATMTENADGYFHDPRWVDSIPFLFALVLRRQ